MSETIKRISTPRTSIWLFALFLLFSGVLFNWGYYANITSTDALIDSTFNYTPTRAYELLTSYGEAGRTNYIYSLPFDYLYSTLLALAMITALTRQAHRLFPNRPALHKTYWLPILFAAADYLENVGLFLMLTNFPDQLNGVATATNLITMTKLSVLMTTMLLFILGGILLLSKRLRGKQS